MTDQPPKVRRPRKPPHQAVIKSLCKLSLSELTKAAEGFAAADKNVASYFLEVLQRSLGGGA